MTETKGTGQQHSEKVLDHFINPRNVGSIDDASAIGNAGNPADGDAVRLTYHWVVDGRRYESGENASLVLPERSKGALVELKVVPNDGRLDGAASHARVQVGNRPLCI